MRENAFFTYMSILNVWSYQKNTKNHVNFHKTNLFQKIWSFKQV